MSSLFRKPSRYWSSYRRLASQCADAERQVESHVMTLDVAHEVTHLARQLLRSIDLRRQCASSHTGVARSHEARADAQIALRRLCNAVRKIGTSH